MPGVLDASALDQLFRDARTRNAWSDTPVTDEEIHAIYELSKWGPTSVNSMPARFVWIRTEEGRQRLAPHLSGNNRAKTMKAPITVIIGYDLDFAENLTKLFPHAPGAKGYFADPVVREQTAFRNSTLQGGYLILAARALGLDAGPMSGFNNAGVDAEFFAGTQIKSNFICSFGHGTDENMFPRSPRLDFDEANTLL